MFRWTLRAVAAVVFLSLAAHSGSTQGSARASSPGSKTPSFEQVKRWIEDYKAAHPGRGGKDWDINAKSAAEIAKEPDTKRLLSICGPNQRPVIPLLAWEYGGSDHRWEDPEASALVYCVCTPVRKPSPGWRFDAAKNRVFADVSIKFPEQNPCKDREGKDQVLDCIGGEGNLEIFADIASLNDGRHVGLRLAESSTELRLVLPSGKKVPLAVID